MTLAWSDISIRTIAVAMALLMVFTLLEPRWVQAKKLYKYQNENGAWVFTDRPPAADVPVEVSPLLVNELPSKISFRNRGTEEAPVLTVTNDYYGPVEVEIDAKSLKNVRVEPPLPARTLIPARSEKTVVTLKPISRSWSYHLDQIRAVVGDPAATHHPQQPYAPPFASGQQFHISQAFDGSFSHHDPQSRYAVDIVLPLGTPVRAARAGTIMEIIGDFFDGGTDPKYQTRANAVRILHDDGTMAIYAHLHPDSIQVAPGQHVERGTWLANSGNTGFSTGPHLHFAIQRNQGMELISIPFEFSDANGQGITPVTGMLLTAY